MRRRSFAEFSVGDVLYFHRTFKSSEFEAFSALSGDCNPLHHDEEYSKEANFDRPIQPSHLTIAPFSAITGMYFPGKPSLYLQQEVKALEPVCYDTELAYSARISAINKQTRTLDLSILVLRDSDVVVQGRILVQCREEEWDEDNSNLLGETAIPATSRPRACVTGASGAIGSAVARALVRDGYDVVLQCRTKNRRVEVIVKLADQLGVEAEVCLADLAQSKGLTQLVEHLRKPLDAIVHTACPPLDAPLSELMKVQFEALVGLSQGALAGMLSKQRGRIVQVGSTAVLSHPPGWEAYVAAKSAADNFVAGLDRAYSRFGVRGLVLAPAAVKTEFSAEHLPDNLPRLLPEEVAESVCGLLSQTIPQSYTIMEVGGTRAGRWGFSSAPVERESEIVPLHSNHVANESGDHIDDKVDATVRRVFKLGEDADLSEAGLGLTPGWDSLGHIVLMLELETVFQTKLNPTSFEETHTLAGIRRLIGG